jgi:3D (Asp-Asp-Asp) domain-containing protein
MISIILASMLAADWQPLEVVATAYCPCKICCGVRGVRITADGTDTREEPYGVASDPKQLPYGSTVWIPTGIGYLDHSRPTDDQRQFTVDDTGGLIRRNTRRTGIVHIDLRFVRHSNALKFGKKTITIYVWKD